MRLAIAHEWLASRAGSEKTFEAMAGAFPDADLYALTREEDVDFDFGRRPVTTTFLDRFAFTRHRRELTLPLMPLAWRLIDVRAPYDKVITSSHACVKAFPPGKAAEHYCYCYAPMRYAWDPDIDTRTARSQAVLRPALSLMRRWDLRSADHVDHFAGISTAVAERITAFYGREARVIHPPVDTEWYTPGDKPVRERALAISRFIPYKRIDLAIEACARAGVPLTVAGWGPREGELRSLASALGADVRFEIKPSDDRLRELYRSSLAVVFPANEDFGIVPVEAQACGTPVVALDVGGSRDTVLHGETGYRVPSPDRDLLAEAVREVAKGEISEATCRRNAERFSVARFKRELREWLEPGAPGDGG
ncbi:MAG TPA: glycosyltransferase [Thermoleophilaceae bacterium]|nr:glycosyltransferase [Thermoleophilaceae bacterium]